MLCEVLQMSYVMPLPHIRYTRELSLSVDDLAKHDKRRQLRAKQLEEHNGTQYVFLAILFHLEFCSKPFRARVTFKCLQIMVTTLF